MAFAEGGDGTSNVIGQFVSDTGGVTSRAIRSISGQRHHREVTLANGRRRIMHLASALKLNATHVDAAFRFFMLAVQHNFTQGRRTPNVVAACLYIVCRRHKTPHMLIDFSDVLQTNLFVLGNTFFRLCRTLRISPPLIDPSLYIHRFAAALNLGEHELDVANTALRLVQRMKRDWIQIGRRPAGVCGAALFIAARIHRVIVNQQLILHTVKICDMTLRRRVVEFRNLPSAQLSFEEFQRRNPEYKGDLEGDLTDETSCDPPIFQYHRRKEEEARKRRQFDLLRAATADETTNTNDNSNDNSNVNTNTNTVASSNEQSTNHRLPLQNAAGLSSSSGADPSSSKSNPKKRGATSAVTGAPDTKRRTNDGFAVPTTGSAAAAASKSSSTASNATFGESTERQEMDEAFDEMLEQANAGTDVMDDKETSYGFGVDEQMSDAIADANDRHLTEMNASALQKPPMSIAPPGGSGTTTQLTSVPLSDLRDDAPSLGGGGSGGVGGVAGVGNLLLDETEFDASDIPDSEVEQYLNSDEQARIKEIIWLELNREYLEEMEEKKKNAAQLESEGRQPKKRARAPRNAAERAALAAAPPPKERSKGINWEAINRANQLRVSVGTSKTRHWMEGDEEAATGEDEGVEEDEDEEERRNAAPPPVRPPPSAFLGSLRPTIPTPSQTTTQTTTAYDEEEDYDDEEEEADEAGAQLATPARRTSTGSRGDEHFDPFFSRRLDQDEDYESWV